MVKTPQRKPTERGGYQLSTYLDIDVNCAGMTVEQARVHARHVISEGTLEFVRSHRSGVPFFV